jgi:hypothetical protein
MRLVSIIHSIRQSVCVAGCAAAICVAALQSALVAPLQAFKADYACRALVTDPASAANLHRPYALRYRAAPLRVCVPDDTNTFARLAFA